MVHITLINGTEMSDYKKTLKDSNS